MARYGSMVALVIRETVYGTDPVPTAGANAILFQDVTLTPIEADQVERPMVVPHYGNDPILVTARRNRLAGAIDLAGSGALGTVPGYGPLLRACGLAETITASTRVDYDPVSINEDSCTFYHFLDGTRQIGTGGRGSFGIELAARQIPRLRFDMQALYAVPTAVALPNPTLTGFQAPLVVSQANTPTCTLNGQAVRLQSFSYDHGNQIVMRDMPNSRALRIVGRQPRATLTIEAPDAVSPDFFTPIGSLVAVSIIHGTVAGNIVEITMAQARVLPSLRYGNDGNIATLTIELRPEPTLAGNNEFNLKIR
ncbi:MAG: hypothetical protein K2X74_23310 [Acetobacteraceae bacterium]|nr:hypothetical protein [Acetobacteraceae bacterium]